MKEKLKKILKNSLKLIPLPIYEALFPLELTGFFYHAITTGKLPHVENLYQPVSAQQFETTLINLKKKYTFVSYQEIVDASTGKKQLPKNAAHLSFDDGFSENHTIVMPILQKLEIPCMFFLTSEWIDNRSLFYRSKVSLCVNRVNQMNAEELKTTLSKIDNINIKDKQSMIKQLMNFIQADEDMVEEYCQHLGVDTQQFLQEQTPFLTSAQIQEMHAAGFVFGGHSVSHRKFIQLPPERVEQEIVQSCKKIQEITGQEKVPFAFPNSATGFDRKTLSEIRNKNKFLGLFFNSKGIIPDENFMFNRIWMERNIADGKPAKTWQAYLKHAYQEYTWKKILTWNK